MIRKDELFPIGTTHAPHALQGEITCSFTNTVFDEADAPFFVLEIVEILLMILQQLKQLHQVLEIKLDLLLFQLDQNLMMKIY